MPVRGFGNTTDKPRKRYSSDPSERARELVAEGRLGGARPGSGRPPKKRTEAQAGERRTAASVIAAWAREHGEQMAQVFVDVLDDPDASDRQKIHAVKVMLGIESKEAELQLLEERNGSRRELPIAAWMRIRGSCGRQGSLKSSTQ